MQFAATLMGKRGKMTIRSADSDVVARLFQGFAMPASVEPPADPFKPYVPSAQQPFDERWLCHLLRRSAFGATAERLKLLEGKSPEAVIDWLMSYDPQQDPFDALVNELEGFVNFNRADSVASYWFYRMLNSPHPLQERIALFWHNRFATSAGKVGNGRLMHVQIQTLRKLGLESFRDLLIAMGRDPAMLIWLDGQTNRKGKPNENYAREVMELFTLGIGNYTEKDVKELARAMTGWRIEGEGSTFDPKLFDDGEKQILGHRGNFDSEAAADILLAQPAAPKHLAQRLLKEFVHADPTDEQVNHYAQRLLDNKWEIKPVLREMLSSNLFFSRWAYRSRIKSPVDLVVGAAWAVGGKVSTDFLRDQATRLGQTLLSPPNVKGWPGGETWINSNTVLLRFNFALAIATQRNNNEFVRRSDLDTWLAKNEIKSADDVLQYYSRLLLDGQLPIDAQSKFLDYMNRDGRNKPVPFKLTADMVNTKVRGLLHLMMTMP
jgi:uncharacterized protein (DUF1800 family)